MTKLSLPRIETGVRNLDALLHGGLPKGAVLIVGGAPGTGKTTLAQQICFHASAQTASATSKSTSCETPLT